MIRVVMIAGAVVAGFLVAPAIAVWAIATLPFWCLVHGGNRHEEDD